MTPKVSILVVLYNGIRHIEPCLHALLESLHGLALEVEVLVIDNASQDEGPARVREAFPRLRLLRSPVNRGYAGGLNLGLSVASGEYVVALNQDTRVQAGWLTPLVDFLDAHPGAGAVGPVILLARDADRINAAGATILPSGIGFCRDLHRPILDLPAQAFVVPGLSGACYMVRRNLLERLGGAPELCFMGNDDVVLSWQLRLLGSTLHVEPASRVEHSYHLSIDPQKLFWLERNRLALLASALGKFTLLVMTPYLLATDAAVGTFCLLKGPAFAHAKLRSYHALWQQRGEIASSRRRLQALRQVSDWQVLSALDLFPPIDQLARALTRTPPRL